MPSMFGGDNRDGVYDAGRNPVSAGWVAPTRVQPVPLSTEKFNAELLDIVRQLTLSTNEGDDIAQGTHYFGSDGRVHCKGSFLALIERARAAIAVADSGKKAS